jgi:hypothetical protein
MVDFTMLRDATPEPGDAILVNYGWAMYWNNPQKYNDARFFVGENQGSPGIGVEVARWAGPRTCFRIQECLAYS